MLDDFIIGSTAEEQYNEEDYPFDPYDEEEVDIDIPQNYGGCAPWKLF